MTLYTKRQFEADKAANAAAIVANAALIQSFFDRADAGENVAEFSDEWNAAHDRTHELEAEAREIETRFRRRRWTAADHAAREMVVANID